MGMGLDRSEGMSDDKLKRVIDTFWWSGGTGTVGAIAIKSREGWKAYIGQATGLESEKFDAQRILDYGTKLSKEAASAIFPNIKEDYLGI